MFDTGDLVMALEDGGYEMGSRKPVVVPEPTGWLLLLMGLLPGLLRRPAKRCPSTDAATSKRCSMI